MNAPTLIEVAGRLKWTPVTGAQRSVFRSSNSDPMQRSEPLRLLVVDDEPSVAEILQFCLSDEGYVIESASDGISGLDRFRHGNWDIIVMDRCMPRMSGCELALAIRALAPDIPIVMLTGLPELLEQEGECARAIDAVVRKPFTLRQVREAILQALRSHGRS